MTLFGIGDRPPERIGLFRRAELLRHEGAHVLTAYEQALLSPGMVVRVFPEPISGVGAALSRREWQPDSLAAQAAGLAAVGPLYDEEHVELFRDVATRRVESVAIVMLSGVAAQFYRGRGWSRLHQIAAAGDLLQLESVAHRWRVPINFWHWWDVTIARVDARWGALDAMVEAFGDRDEMLAEDLIEVALAAPTYANPDRERPWEEIPLGAG